MKRFGPIGDGTYLINMAIRELRSLAALSASLAEMTADLPEQVDVDGLQVLNVLHPPAHKNVEQKVAKKAKKKNAPLRGAATEGAGKTCAACGEDFTPWRKDQQQCSKCSKGRRGRPVKAPVKNGSVKYAICGKPFVPARKDVTTCSQEYKRAKERAYAKTHGKPKPTDPVPSPLQPVLTPAMNKAARLALIAQRARATEERDPIETARKEYERENG